MFKQFWLWIKSLPARFMALFKKDEQPPNVNEPAIKPGDVLNEQPVPKTASAVDQAEAAIRLHAELYETNQPAFMSELEEHEDAFIEAAYRVDWPAIVRGYDNATIHRIQGSGTNFNFKGHPELRRMVAAAVAAESARRAPDAPATNGMADDGGWKG